MSTTLSSVAPARRGAEGRPRHLAVDAVEDRGGLEQDAAERSARPRRRAAGTGEHDEREQRVEDRDVDRPDAGNGAGRSQVMRCEIGRFSQRETRPSPGLPVARTISQDGAAAAGAGPSPGRSSTVAGAAQPLDIGAASPAPAAPPSPILSRIRAGARLGQRAHRARRGGDAGDPPVRRRRRRRRRRSRPRIFRFPSCGSLPQETVPTRFFRQKGGRIMATARAADIRPRRPRRASCRTRSTSISTIRSRRGWRGCCVPTGISPNVVSVMSAARLVAATCCLRRCCAWPANALIGFALHAALARHRRRRRRSRPDDRARPRRPASWSTASATISATSSCISPSPSCSTTAIGGWAWVLAWSAGASHVVQTNHAETQRRALSVAGLWRALAAQRRGRRRRRVPQGELVHPLFRLLGGRLCLALQPDDARAPTRSTRRWPRPRAIRARPSASARMVRRDSRDLAAPRRRRSAPIPRPSSSARSMLLGSPLYYFLAMIFGVNLILLVSILHHRKVAARLAAALGRDQSSSSS